MIKQTKNKYCSFSSLRNESDVEQFLVTPLLADLGVGPDYLETKATIPDASVGKGKKKKSYAPDYVAYTARNRIKPVLIIDAKHPNERAEDGVKDAQLYASVIRRRMAEPKREQYCIGVNGHLLIVKHYDSDKILHSLSFSNFTNGDTKFAAFRKDFERDALAVRCRSRSGWKLKVA
jgi:type I site-specific restriction endonuclease